METKSLVDIFKNLVLNPGRIPAAQRISTGDFALLMIRLKMLDELDPLIEKLIELPIPHAAHCDKVKGSSMGNKWITCNCDYMELKTTIIDIARIAGYCNDESPADVKGKTH